MIIVADSSPLISLAIIDKLDLLEKIYEKIIVSEAVFKEISIENKPQKEKLIDFLENRVNKVNNNVAVSILNKDIDIGEAESIVLALEQGIKLILIDDLKGRKYAEYEGLKIIGTLGLLLKAKEKNLINDIKSLLDILIENKIRIGKELYEIILEKAGENI